ncbi:hypothetical protein EI94DRAFT_1793256 [Lactarius quietus]|nr:hypothetical protein EI94DRAFT_1793256 [Lactarius quietus]
MPGIIFLVVRVVVTVVAVRDLGWQCSGEARLRGGQQQSKVPESEYKGSAQKATYITQLQLFNIVDMVNPVQAVHTPTNDGDSYNNNTAMMGDVQQPHNNGGDGDDNLRSDDDQAVGEGDGDGDLVPTAAAGGT